MTVQVEEKFDLYRFSFSRERRRVSCRNRLGGKSIKIGIIEESDVLKKWYIANGFVHIGTKKYDHLPFTSGYLEWKGE